MARTDLNQEFQRVLGRAPNASELSFWGRFIDEGHLQPYEVGQYLQATPEASQSRFPAQAEQYTKAITAQDEELLRRAGDSLSSTFYQQGRPRSSGYTSAYLNAARDLAIARQPQIADFYRQGIQNVEANFGRDRGILQRGYGLRDELRQRSWEIEDYYRQQNDYNTYLNAMNRRRRNKAIGQLIGGGAGTAIGAYLGSKVGQTREGAQAGGQTGSEIGGALGEL